MAIQQPLSGKMIVITNEIREITVATLCEDIWDLPNQLDFLKEWLKLNISTLQKDHHIADIGFGIRPEACGGGGVLDLELIELISKARMEIYFSEYNFVEIGKEKK